MLEYETEEEEEVHFSSECFSVVGEGKEMTGLLVCRHQNQHVHAGRPGVPQRPVPPHQPGGEARRPVLLRRLGRNQRGESRELSCVIALMRPPACRVSLFIQDVKMKSVSGHTPVTAQHPPPLPRVNTLAGKSTTNELSATPIDLASFHLFMLDFFVFISEMQKLGAQ